MTCQRFHRIACALVALVAIAVVAGACARRNAVPPLATPSLSLNHPDARLGGPLEISYTFDVAHDAHFDEDYRIMVHVVDNNETLLWTDDHDPPVPTRQWRPDQRMTYTRTVFVPMKPYLGAATIQMGLYSNSSQRRVTLAGKDAGQHAYTVAQLQLLPPTGQDFKEGWHPPEVSKTDSMVEWRWTTKQATLSFRNPMKDSLLYLDVDNPSTVFHEPQHVRLELGDHLVDEFTLVPTGHELRKIPLSATQLGQAPMTDVRISIDKTFTPALLDPSNSKDPRQLGIRVFHAVVDPR